MHLVSVILLSYAAETCAILQMRERLLSVMPEQLFSTFGNTSKLLWDWSEAGKASNYSSRPDESEWHARLVDAVRKGAEDPCRATIQATIGHTRRSGFGSRMNGFINEFAVAIAGGFPIALRVNPGDDMSTTVWPNHFVNVANLGVCNRKMDDNKEVAYQAGMKMAQKLNRIDPAYIEKLKRFILPFVYTYNPQTQARLDVALASWLPAGGAPYVGVHIRHGDKSDESPPFATEVYGEKIKDFDAGSPRPVFLATDDSEAKSKLQHALGSGYAAISQQPFLSQEAYTTRLYSDEEAVFAVMADIESLRRADLFIGTSSSNMGRLIWLLRDQSKESFSLDFDNQWMVLGGLQTSRPGRQ